MPTRGWIEKQCLEDKMSIVPLCSSGTDNPSLASYCSQALVEHEDDFNISDINIKTLPVLWDSDATRKAAIAKNQTQGDCLGVWRLREAHMVRDGRDRETRFRRQQGVSGRIFYAPDNDFIFVSSSTQVALLDENGTWNTFAGSLCADAKNSTYAYLKSDNDTHYPKCELFVKRPGTPTVPVPFPTFTDTEEKEVLTWSEFNFKWSDMTHITLSGDGRWLYVVSSGKPVNTRREFRKIIRCDLSQKILPHFINSFSNPKNTEPWKTFDAPRSHWGQVLDIKASFHGKRVVMFTEGDGICLSEDFGATWRNTHIDFPNDPKLPFSADICCEGMQIFLAQQGQLYVSSDFGAFSEITLPGDFSAHTVAVDPLGKTLLVGSLSGGAFAKFYSGGWTEVTAVDGAVPGPTVGVSRSGDMRLCVLAGQGYWTSVGPQVPSYDFLSHIADQTGASLHFEENGNFRVVKPDGRPWIESIESIEKSPPSLDNQNSQKVQVEANSSEADQWWVTDNGLYLLKYSPVRGNFQVLANVLNSSYYGTFCTTNVNNALKVCTDAYIDYCRAIGQVDPRCTCIDREITALNMYSETAMNSSAANALEDVTPCVAEACRDHHTEQSFAGLTAQAYCANKPINVCYSSFANSGTISGAISVATECGDGAVPPPPCKTDADCKGMGGKSCTNGFCAGVFQVDEVAAGGGEAEAAVSSAKGLPVWAKTLLISIGVAIALACLGVLVALGVRRFQRRRRLRGE